MRAIGAGSVVWLLLGAGLGTGLSEAHEPQVVRYPRVFGFMGRPYGPTQAHYQYQKQYGRPWHGYGGQTAVIHDTAMIGSYALPVYGMYGYGLPYRLYGGSGHLLYGGPTIGPFVSQHVWGPTWSWQLSGAAAPARLPDWNANVGIAPAAPLREAWRDNVQRWQQPLEPVAEEPQRRRAPRVPSTTAARLRSLEAQSQGDARFRQQDYRQAYLRYRAALQAANDQPAPFFRVGFALIAQRQFDSAADYFRQGLERQRDWPDDPDSLASLYGDDNQVPLQLHLGQLTAWVREDIRDPERLFVMGVFLTSLEQPAKAAVFLEAAWRLSGGGRHLEPFLDTVIAANPTTIAPPQPREEPAAGLPVPPPPVEPQAPPAVRLAPRVAPDSVLDKPGRP